MPKPSEQPMPRRDLLIKAAPACAAACAGFCSVEGLAALGASPISQEQHRFDVPRELSLSTRQQERIRRAMALGLIMTLRQELGDLESIRLLKLFSAETGRRGGARQAQSAADTSFATFVAIFRPPAMEDGITHEVVEDTEKAFSIRVTECIHAEVFRRAGMGGEIGHAALCNGDYYRPVAFNPNFRMERSKTLMQGDDHCNHRFIDDS